MKKLIHFTLLLFVAHVTLQAQDEAIFMHYTVSPILVNPAAAGFNGNYNLQFNTRLQWTGFEDAPRTIAARYHGPLFSRASFGVGVWSETAAQLSRNKIQFDFAFSLLSEESPWKVSAGPFAEIQQISVDNDITNSPFYDPADDVLENMLNGNGEFDVGLAVYGEYDDRFFGGLTFNNLVSSRLSVIAGTDEAESFFSYYTVLFGHRFALSQKKDRQVTLEPSLLMRQIRNTPYQFDLNLKAGFADDQFVAGLSYRAGLGAMGLLLGTRLPIGLKRNTELMLYYSGDVSFQRFQQFNSGSHEITVALQFKKSDKKKTDR